MPTSNSKVTKRIKQILFLLTAIAFSARAVSAQHSPSDQLKQEAVEGAAVARGENRESLKRYKGENGILSAKTVIFGGEFRVTTVIPFKGNFAEYHHLEIAKPASLVGKALTPDEASRQVAKFKSQFASRRLFETVTVIDVYDPATASQHQQSSSANAPSGISDELDRAESLDAPIGSFNDLIARDKRRTFGADAGQRPASNKTLVVVIEVIDYAKGGAWISLIRNYGVIRGWGFFFLILSGSMNSLNKVRPLRSKMDVSPNSVDMVSTSGTNSKRRYNKP